MRATEHIVSSVCLICRVLISCSHNWASVIPVHLSEDNTTLILLLNHNAVRHCNSTSSAFIRERKKKFTICIVMNANECDTPHKKRGNPTREYKCHREGCLQSPQSYCSGRLRVLLCTHPSPGELANVFDPFRWFGVGCRERGS